MPVAMTVEELERFFLAEFPQAFYPESGLTIEAVWERGCRVRQAFRHVSVRPGGTISGPTMMALADFAMYVAVLAAIGPVPLAVTINLGTCRHAGYVRSLFPCQRRRKAPHHGHVLSRRELALADAT